MELCREGVAPVKKAGAEDTNLTLREGAQVPMDRVERRQRVDRGKRLPLRVRLANGRPVTSKPYLVCVEAGWKRFADVGRVS